MSPTLHLYVIYYQNTEQIKTPKESPKQNCKILQARFGCACSWTVPVSANYRPRPLSPPA